MLTILASLLLGTTLAFLRSSPAILRAPSVRPTPSDLSRRIRSRRCLGTAERAQAALNRTAARPGGATTAGDRGTAAPGRRASDWYYKRLAIHKTASFATAPLFVAEYIVGDKLFDEGDASGNLKSTHQALTTGIGALFGVNTVTGVWNLWEGPTKRRGAHDDSRMRR